MTDRRHYEAHARKPIPGTLYDFLVCGFEILASSNIPAPDVIFAPPADDGEQPSKERLLSANMKANMEDEAIELLRSAGVPDDNLTRPFRVGVDRAVTSYVDCWKLELVTILSAAAEGGPATGCPPLLEIPAHLRVLAHAGWTTGNAKAADYLNSGVRTSTPGLLTRDHVRRAGKRYFDLLLRRVNGRAVAATRILKADFYFDAHWFEALSKIHNEAINRSEFRAFRGAELALRIHQLRGLPSLVDRIPDLNERAGIHDHSRALTLAGAHAQMLLLARLPRPLARLFAA